MRTVQPKKSLLLIALAALLLPLIVAHISTSAVSKKSIRSRAGFGISTTADPIQWAHTLHASWYVDWKTTAISSGAWPEYWQMIRLSGEGTRPSVEEVRRLAVKYPGHVWIIGNEPDNIWQDNIEAELYAQYYHDLYVAIKHADPTAKIAVGAVSQPTPLRFAYLEQVLAEHQRQYGHPLPVDWWTVHAYVLREEKDSWGAEIPPGMDAAAGERYEIEDHGDLAIFEENILRFRQWMWTKGYRNTPLAVTEFGILMPQEFGFNPQRVSAYLDATFKWLYAARDPQVGMPADDFRLVQKFAWFSLGDVIYPVADLVDFSTMQLTPVGEQFQASSMEIEN